MALRAEGGSGDPEHVLLLDPFEMRLGNVVVELAHGVVAPQRSGYIWAFTRASVSKSIITSSLVVTDALPYGRGVNPMNAVALVSFNK